MEQVAHIHCLQLIFLAFHQFQAVFEEMGIGAGCKLLQPCDAPLKGLPVKRPGRRPPYPSLLIGIKGRIHQLSYLFPVFIGTIKVTVQFHECIFLCIPALRRLGVFAFLLLPKLPQAVYEPFPSVPDRAYRPVH